MAPAVGDSLRGYFADLIARLDPTPGRIDYAIRLALIFALTALIAETYQSPDIALTMYVALFYNQKDRAKSLILSFAILAAYSITIILVLLIAMVVLNDPMWRVFSIGLVSFGLLFLASASKLKPLGGALALFAAFALDKLGSVPQGEAATRGLLSTWLLFGIPAGVSIVVNLLVARAPRRLAGDTIASKLLLAAAMLRVPDDSIRRRFHRALGEGIAPIQEWIHLATVETAIPSKDSAALNQAARSTLVILSAIDVMDRHAEASLPEWVRAHISELLEQMATILQRGGYPVNVGWSVPDIKLPSPACEILGDIQDSLVHFTEQPVESAARSQKVKGGFLVADAFTNPEHVHYALKTTAAALICFFLYNQLDWPGIHTCFLTCYVVSLGSTAESVEKLLLRVLGCLIGAGAGTAAIVFLIPNLVSIGALMLTVFAGGLVSAYIAGGGPRISYAGYQIAFAFFLCVVQGNAPSFDLTIARDRVVGIIIGDLVAFLIFTSLWPISVKRRLDPGMSAILRRLAALAASRNIQERQVQAAEVRVALTAIQTDLQLARYEPVALRPSSAQLARHAEAVQCLTDLQSTLFLAANQQAPLPPDISLRLRALSDLLRQSGSSEPVPQKRFVHFSGDPLQSRIGVLLTQLERVLAQGTGQWMQEAVHASV